MSKLSKRSLKQFDAADFLQSEEDAIALLEAAHESRSEFPSQGDWEAHLRNTEGAIERARTRWANEHTPK